MEKCILGIESAVAVGSLALFDGTTEIAAWSGGDIRITAESLLPRIDELMRSAGRAKQDLTDIAVSAGPGSFTGIRIGMATCGGLATALGIPLTSHSVLDAMAHAYQFTGTAAIPMGRDMVCTQPFIGGKAAGRASSVPVGSLQDVQGDLLVHEQIARVFEGRNAKSVGSDLAALIARYALAGSNSRHAPIFISRS